MKMEGRGHSTSEREREKRMAVKGGSDGDRQGQIRRVGTLTPGKEKRGRYVPHLQGRKCAAVSVVGSLDQESANYGLKAKCGTWPGFTNKVLLAHSHIYSFMYRLLCFHYESRDGTPDRDCLAHKPETIYALALYSLV